MLNPALIAYDLPVTLGGTSNHLRTEVVRGLGGWDSWNVTEDADLGLRLALARGEFTVIYDAEDVPEPGQLRLAAAIFAANEPRLACLQARLAIDNTRDSWLTRGLR